MNRQQALEHLLANVEDWWLHGLAEVPQKGGWLWMEEDGEILYYHISLGCITRQDWLNERNKKGSRKMKNADALAMPIELNGFGQYEPAAFTGMTKREHFAAMAMQGMLSNQYVSDFNGSEPAWNDKLARRSVSYADALLEELSK